jgi:Peptidase family M28
VPVVLVGLVLLLAGGRGDGGGSEGGARSATAAPGVAPRASVNRFDGAAAFRLLREQVELGPRPAGSAASRRLAEQLRMTLPNGRFEAVPGGLRNVVGELPGRGRAVLVAAHYDTKDLPGFVGANDGAGGTAAVVELARALQRSRPAGGPPVRFVLFDGEETPRGVPDEQFASKGIRGSRAYVKAHRDALPQAMILLDFVADRRLSIPREWGSSRALWARLRGSARAVGVEAAFPDRIVGEVLDDHTPFRRADVPAINLIDFEFACWHRRCDDLSAVSERSLDASGEAVLQLLRSWPRR